MIEKIYLIPETIQETNRVHLQDRMDLPCTGVQIRINMLRKEGYDVYQRVRARHALARRRAPRRNCSHQVHRGVLVAPCVALLGAGSGGLVCA